MTNFTLFENLGGKFYIENSIFINKLGKIKAYIFDWDGVFNDGSKTDSGSSYSEVDSMGINMLRFAHWLRHKNLPITAIMTGENNQPAFFLAKREKFHSVYYKFANKQFAFEHFLEEHKLKPNEVAFCFDDILDLSIAAKCGLRFLIRREASPLFERYVEKNRLVDYKTANVGGKFAIREVSELILGMNGAYDKTIEKRQNFDQDYQNYLAERNKQIVNFFILKDDVVTVSEI